MKLHEVTPEVLTVSDQQFSEFTIVPIGDVQVQQASNTVAERSLREHIKEILDTQPNPLFVGMGDYIDVMSPSNRAKLSSSGFYDSTHAALAEAATQLEERFVKLVEGTEGKWLGFHSGHHFFQHSDGSTSDTRIAQALGGPFLGVCAYTKIRVMQTPQRARGIITLWSHHGEGSRKYPASKIVDHVAPYWPDVDIFLMGHMHKADYQRIPRLVIKGGKVVKNDALAVVTGGWLKSFVVGESNYVEKKLLAPRCIGAPYIRVKPTRENKGFSRRLQYIEG